MEFIINISCPLFLSHSVLLFPSSLPEIGNYLEPLLGATEGSPPWGSRAGTPETAAHPERRLCVCVQETGREGFHANSTYGGVVGICP